MFFTQQQPIRPPKMPIEETNAKKSEYDEYIEEILRPPTLQHRIDKIKERAIAFGKRIPHYLYVISLATLKYTWMFIKRPAIIVDWYFQGTAKMKEIVHHYWVGFKLLGADIHTSITLLKSIAQGKQLTRRQKHQLKKTVADIFRIVPFSFFIIVPFMEFALPFFIKLFPNMLPSQFQDQMKKEEQMRKTVKAQLAMAAFLQDTVALMAKDIQQRYAGKEAAKEAEQLKLLIDHIREGKPVSNEDIVKLSRLFNDEITLDNISRPQLIAMAKFLGLNAFGTDALLRFRLRTKIKQIRADDMLIHWEGVNSLSTQELIAACKERGMKYTGTKEELRKQLQNWLQLSMNKKVPTSLLILSRAFKITEAKTEEEALKSAIGSLDDEVVEEASQDIPAPKYEVNIKKLEHLKRQLQLIKEEIELIDSEKADEIEPEEEISEDKMAEIFEALTALSSNSVVKIEKEELEELKERFVEAAKKHDTPQMQRVKKTIAKMIKEIEKSVDNVDKIVGDELQLLDQDKDGIISTDAIVEYLHNTKLLTKEELTPELINSIINKLDKNQDGKVSVKDLILELREIKMNLEQQEK